MFSRRHAAVVTLLAVALAAGGCGAGSPDEGEVKAVDINAKPRDELRQGGTLRLAIQQMPTQFNSNHLNGPNGSTNQIMGGLMPGGFISDEKANLKPDTDYILSARVSSTRPRQVITYRLNPKARWSDGKPITWRDYEAQWRALRSPTGAYEIASSTGYERVASVRRGRDDYEVVVTFARRYGEWQGLFSPLFPASTNRDPRAFNSGWLNRIPVTAGAFKVGEINRTAKTVTIVPDPKWWGRKPLLDRIVFRALSVEAGISAYVSGEVDVVDVGPDPSAYRRVRNVEGGAVRRAAGPDFRHFTINGTSPLLRDVNVRRAVAMAINREAITRADLTGLPWPAKTMGNHFFVNTQEGYRDNSGQVGRFDPARARELLDRAGWRRGPGGYRRKGGRTLTLRFVIPSDVPTSRNEGDLAQGMLRAVGIKLDVRSVPENDFFDKYVSGGNFDITPFSWLGTVFPISSAKSIYVKPLPGPDGELQVQQNYARVGSPKIDSLMNRAQEELDPAKARELINQADKLVWDEVHSLVIFQRPQITAVKANLANIGSSGFKTTPYQDVGFVK